MRPVVLLAAALQPCAPLVLEAAPGPAPDQCVDRAFVTIPGASPACGDGAAAVLRGRAHGDVSAALADARDGDVVWVCPGEHPLSASIVARRVALVGVPGPEVPTLHGLGSRVLDVQDSIVTVADLCLEGGVADDGGGIRARGGALQLARVAMQGHVATGAGGAVWAENAALEIVDGWFGANRSESAGGAVAQRDGCGEVRGTMFEGNEAAGRGGALAWFGAAPTNALTIAATSFFGNTAQNGGALAVVADGVTAQVRVEGSAFESNLALADGGAVSVSGAAAWHLDSSASTYVGNTAFARGGALHTTSAAPASSLSVADLYLFNQAFDRGGAWFHQARSPVDVLDLVDGLFDGNVAASGQAVAVGGTGRVEIALLGGLLGVSPNAPAPAGDGGPVLLHPRGDVVGEGVAFPETGLEPTFVSTECGSFVLTGTASFSCVGGVWTGP